MRFAIGENSASCSHCNAEQFEPVPSSGDLLQDRRFRCVVCHSEFAYAELLIQISERVIRDVKAARVKA